MKTDDAAGVEKRVFTLWPTPEGVDPTPGDAMPVWASGQRGGRPFHLNATELVMVIALVLAGVGVYRSGSVLWLATGALVALALASSLLRRRKEDVEAAWREALFERPGISLWREDWSAVGEAILKLKRDGVHDIEAYFAAHADEARALRRRVIVKDVNAFTVQTMGAQSKADLVGPLDRILPDSDQTFDQWLIAFGRGDAFYRSETHIVRPDGSHLDCLFTAALPTSLNGFRNILVAALDVTDYKALQARLFAAQTEAARASRISTVGALTASITHEINTPLAAILANVQAALRWMRRDDPNYPEAERAIERAVADVSRTQEVVGRTRDFLSASPPKLEPLDIAETARIATVLIDRELRLHDASVHLDAATDLPKVMADSIQMQQVLVNLLINGVQAMKSQPAPRDVRVMVRAVDGDVLISVSDQGPGVASAVRSRLFEPFTSYKKGGMGMGLAICKTSIEAIGGRIWLDEDAALGATFHVRVPAAS
jgi:C4-dicarboxylate-specific signal transduction histidine kinase